MTDPAPVASRPLPPAPVTDPLRDLVRQLHAPRGWRWPGAPDPRVPVLAELGRLGDVAVLPNLLGPLAVGGVVGRAAARAADEILRRTPAVDYALLDARIRNAWWWVEDARLGWGDLDAGHLVRKAPSGWLRMAYFGLASLHRNGRVREAAVQALAEERSGDEIPFLVLRLNDWVGAVRARAEDAVRDRLRPEYRQAWTRALPLVLGLDDRERHQAEFVVQGVLRLLTATPDALREVLASSDRAVRRAGHRVARDQGGGSALLAARLALDDPDVVVRLDAAAAVRAGDVADPDVEAALLGDPAADVRRRVLLGLVERDAPRADAALREALLDGSAGIRADARFFLAQRTGEPVGADVYRDALSGQATACGLRAALGGLGETGDASDAVRAAPYLEDERASVRAAALGTVLSLAAEAYAPRLLDLARDPLPRVVRTLVRAVASGALPVPDPQVTLDRWRHASSGVLAYEALRALAGRPFWTQLPYLLDAYGAADARTSRLAEEGVARWLDRSNRVFTTPTAAERQALRRALSETAAPDSVRREVGAVLDRLG